MKKLIVALLGALTVATVSAAPATTAERHTAKGLDCTSCHVKADKTLPVRKDACLKCHVSYKTLAERTAKVKPNPHDNHFGERDCSTCHRGHKPSVVSCDACHKFNLKTP